MSQTEFAHAVQRAGDALGEPNVANKRLIQKWESGEHTDCRPNYRRALRRVTGEPFHKLGFTGAPEDPGLAGSYVRPADALLVSGPADGDLESLACGPWDRLRFALRPPGQADVDTIGLVQATTDRFFDLERHHRARELLTVVEQEIEDICALLAGTRRETLRRRLALIGGQAAALAGWLAWERSDLLRAQRWWDAALAGARHAVDGPLLACVFTYTTYACVDRADDLAAWELAHAAVAHAGTDARARACAAARAAETAAMAGRRHEAFAELELAITLGGDLTPVGPADPAAPWARFFDRACLWAKAAGIHSRFKNHTEAMSCAERALRLLGPDEVKARAVVLAEVACVAAAAGEVTLAVDCGREAVDLARNLESALAMRALRSLLPVLTAHTAVPAVRDLLHQLKYDPPTTSDPHGDANDAALLDGSGREGR
jgi:tetratricopeptide (TPR) repeat protein